MISQEDRELLELSAKAAGYHVRYVSNSNGSGSFYMEPSQLWWNPLDDDGDAFRLAMGLRISIDVNHMFVHADCRNRENDIGYVEENTARNDGCIMTSARRAIVRVAAVIGELMP